MNLLVGNLKEMYSESKQQYFILEEKNTANGGAEAKEL